MSSFQNSCEEQRKIPVMNVELVENRSRSVDTLAAASDYMVTEKGDVTHRPKSAGMKKRKKPPEPDVQKEKAKKQEDNKKQQGVLEIPSPFKTVSERAPLMDLNGLLHITPEPFPLLNATKTSQVSIIADQVHRMKNDIAKLQKFAEEFKCMEKYKADIDFLVVNLNDAIE